MLVQCSAWMSPHGHQTMRCQTASFWVALQAGLSTMICQPKGGSLQLARNENLDLTWVAEGSHKQTNHSKRVLASSLSFLMAPKISI